VFQVPEPIIPRGAARVKDLQDPTKKMSKSAPSELAKVMILDEPNVILKKFKKAVTDSLGVIQWDETNQPGVANLLEIWCAATHATLETALAHFSHNMYGKLKVETAEAVIAVLNPVRERYRALLADPAYLETVLRRGGEAARQRAEPTIRRTLETLGLPVAGFR
jgi:tryptophanyl-tRNA synthetase